MSAPAGRSVGPRVVPWIGLLARVVVGGVWVVAGAIKLPDPQASVEAVRAYELLPGWLVEPVGLVLPPLEVVLGVALLAGLLTRAAGMVSALLLVGFVVGIGHAWATGLNIDCGCFGGGGYDPDAAAKYPWEIARDVALLAASLWLVRWPRTSASLDGVLFRPRAADDPDDPDGPDDPDDPDDPERPTPRQTEETHL